MSSIFFWLVVSQLALLEHELGLAKELPVALCGSSDFYLPCAITIMLLVVVMVFVSTTMLGNADIFRVLGLLENALPVWM